MNRTATSARRYIAATLAITAAACAHTVVPPATSPLVGTWRLVEYWNRDRADQPKRYPYGDPPLGFIVYDAAGNVFVQIAKNPQPDRVTPDALNRLTAEELRTMLHEFVAYFGTYTVDAGTSTVVHHVTADLRREYTATEQSRPFKISGDELVIGDGVTWLRRFVRVR